MSYGYGENEFLTVGNGIRGIPGIGHYFRPSLADSKAESSSSKFWKILSFELRSRLTLFSLPKTWWMWDHRKVPQLFNSFSSDDSANWKKAEPFDDFKLSYFKSWAISVISWFTMQEWISFILTYLWYYGNNSNKIFWTYCLAHMWEPKFLKAKNRIQSSLITLPNKSYRIFSLQSEFCWYLRVIPLI